MPKYYLSVWMHMWAKSILDLFWNYIFLAQKNKRYVKIPFYNSPYNVYLPLRVNVMGNFFFFH